MSYSVNPLKTVKVIDPLIDVNEEKLYAILRGGSEVTYKTISSTSFSNNSAQFTAPPPSPKIIVDRNIQIRMPIRLDFVGTAPPNQHLLQSGFDAFRFMPIAQILNVLTVMINNNTVSINMADVIEPLLRYHTDCYDKEYEYSTSLGQMDQSQNYIELANTIRNPLGYYGDSNDCVPSGRGAFPYNVLQNTNTTARVEAIITEPMFLSPLLFKGMEQGFLGVQNMDFVFNWVSDLSRCWCHDSSAGGVFSSIVVTLGQPQLLFKYVTPPQLMEVPRHIEYNYFDVQRYPTKIGEFLPDELRKTSSQNIQLQSIPRRMYILGRRTNATRNYETTDSYLSIESISINWNNRSGLLASTTKQDLFRMSKKNGCYLSWNQWSGDDMYLLSGSNNIRINGVGSVLQIEFGTDIGLMDVEAPGLDGTYQLQIDVTFKNTNQSETITADMYIIVISEGVFTIQDNRSISQIGVISRQDILDSQTAPKIDYYDVRNAAGLGGDFFGDVKRFAQRFAQGFKEYAPKALNFVKDDILPIAKEVLKMLPMLGLGETNQGGVVVGGELMNRQQLRQRVKQLEY